MNDSKDSGDKPFLSEMANIFNSSGHIIVVGDAILDRFVHGVVNGLAPDAPVSVLTWTHETSVLGGASNIANNIAELGIGVVLVAVVGPDSTERCELERLLDKAGVEKELIEDAGRLTTSKTRFVAHNGQQLLRCDRFSEPPLSKAVAKEVVMKVERLLMKNNVSVLILADNAEGVLTPTVTRRLIQLAHKSDIAVIVDPKGRDYSHYAGADIIKPNRHELCMATGLPTNTDELVVTAAYQLLDSCKFKAVLVTRDSAGMTLVRPGMKPVHISAHAKGEQVVDVNGAGDTVVAALACFLSSGSSILAACRSSSVAAGIVVGKPGTATASMHELDAATTTKRGALSLGYVLAFVKKWRELGLKVGFTNGCFDLLHKGHIFMLEEAASTCDRLVVGINSDASIKRIKGPSRPICNISERSTILSALDSVAVVVEFEEDTPIDLIKSIQPDVLIKGGEYTIDTVVGANFVESYGGEVVITKLGPEISTTSIVGRIIKRNKD